MVGTKKLTELQLRKQTLLLESDLNRLSLYAECERLHETVGRVARLAEIPRVAAPWATILAPAAGMALAFGLRRCAPGGRSFLSRMTAFLPPLFQTLGLFKAKSNEPESEE
jgi:hypothetical protein